MTIEHIEESIQKALNRTSGIDAEILNVRGFSTVHIRELFHALCDFPESINYLEIGLYCGATFCSSFNKNCTSIGIENHFQDFGEGFHKVKKELADNFNKFMDRSDSAYIYYEDCFTMDITELPKIHIYFFDGFHSEETQSKALPHFIDKMSDKFIFIVDDINWPYVKKGTEIGFEILGDKIEVEREWKLRGQQIHNDPVWHNGIDIYLINKK